MSKIRPLGIKRLKTYKPTKYQVRQWLFGSIVISFSLLCIGGESGMKQTKITKSAKGEDCSVRLPTICSFDNDKTILAHLGTSFSAPNRANDFFAAYCCSDCHDVLDGS